VKKVGLCVWICVWRTSSLHLGIEDQTNIKPMKRWKVEHENFENNRWEEDRDVKECISIALSDAFPFEHTTPSPANLGRTGLPVPWLSTGNPSQANLYRRGLICTCFRRNCTVVPHVQLPMRTPDRVKKCNQPIKHFYHHCWKFPYQSSEFDCFLFQLPIIAAASFNPDFGGEPV
jgi:hypothetical protein